MKRIFVSYSRKDENFARRLAAALSLAGYALWLDVEDIPVGMKWSRAIKEGLDSAQILILIMSPNSIASSKVEEEWQYALNRGVRVIPVLYRPAAMPSQLNHLQPVDFHNETFEGAMRRLIDVIETENVMPTDSVAQPKRASGFPAGLLLQKGCLWLVSNAVVVAFLILVVIFGLLKPFQDSTGRSVEAVEVTLPQVDEIVAYVDYARSDESISIEMPTFTERRLWNDELWTQVRSAAGQPQGFAYVPVTDIPGDQTPLYGVPLTVPNLGPTIVVYSRPDFEDQPITYMGIAPEGELLGFWIGESGDKWYFIHHDAVRSGWIVAQAETYLTYLPGYLTLSEATEAYSEPTQRSTVSDLASGTTLFITVLSDGYYEALVVMDGQWRLLYIEQSALALPAPMQTHLSARAQ